MLVHTGMKVNSYWCSNDNFGDAATPYIIKKISGFKAKYVEERQDVYRCLVTGSIIGMKAVSKSLIWGCGMPWKDEKIFKAYDYLMVRGPLTAKRVMKQTGITPSCIGDPVLLLPRFYNPKVEKKHKFGILPSWIDHHIVEEFYSGDDVKIINIMKPIEHVVNSLLECEAVVCSCLHGIVACAAYGIPTGWVEFSDRVVGDGTKFRDFAFSCGFDTYKPLDVRSKVDLSELIKVPVVHPLVHDFDKMLDTCPFRSQSWAHKKYGRLIFRD